MSDIYQLHPSTHERFQRRVTEQYARLMGLPNIRTSRRRLFAAGVTALRTATIEDLERYAALMDEENERGRKGVQHTAVQLLRAFSGYANFFVGRNYVLHKFDRSLRDYLHFGIYALEETDDATFEILCHDSERWETEEPTEDHLRNIS